MSLERRAARRAPRVFHEANGTVSPFPGQHSKLQQIKPLDVIYRRLVRRALKSKQTRHGQTRNGQ